jgi:hypothetical protein
MSVRHLFVARLHPAQDRVQETAYLPPAMVRFRPLTPGDDTPVGVLGVRFYSLPFPWDRNGAGWNPRK